MPRTCSVCNVSLEKRSRNSYHERNETFLCKKCYKVTTRSVLAPLDENNIPIANVHNVSHNIIDVPIERSHNSHKNCIFGCQSNDLRLLSKVECHEIYVQKRIFVKYGARACVEHWVEESLTVPQDFTPHSFSVTLTAQDIQDSFETFAHMDSDGKKQRSSHIILNYE